MAPNLGNGDRELRQQLQQVALELLVGAVNLVDEQHWRPSRRAAQRPQQRPANEIGLAEELLAGAVAIDGVGGLQQPHLEQLAGVVPLVDRVVDVQPFVALEADQLGAQRRRQRPGDRGLADAGFALEEQRPAQREREIHRHRQRAVGDVALGVEQLLDVVDRFGQAPSASRARGRGGQGAGDVGAGDGTAVLRRREDVAEHVIAERAGGLRGGVGDDSRRRGACR